MNYAIISSYSNYYPGDTYENIMVISTVELLGYVCSGLAYDRFKAKKVFTVSFLVSLIGSIGVMCAEEPYLDMLFTFLAKFGISSAY